MGITVTTFTNGTTMVAADQRANIAACLAFLNGAVAAADIAANGVQSRHLRKMEHYGAPTARSQGALGAIATVVADTSPIERRYHHHSAQGPGLWEDVADTMIRLYLPVAGRVEVTCNVWVWSIKAGIAVTRVPEVTESANLRLCIGSTGIEATERRVYDSGHDVAGVDGGMYNYPARNFGMVASRNAAAGWLDISLQCQVIAQVVWGDYSLAIIGASTLNLEYFAR